MVHHLHLSMILSHVLHLMMQIYLQYRYSLALIVVFEILTIICQLREKSSKEAELKPLLLALMLSIHSVVGGIALGIQKTTSVS